MNNPLIFKDPLLLHRLYGPCFCIFYLAEMGIAVIAIIQTIFVALSGAPQPDIRNFSAQLAIYLQQVVAT